MRGGQRVWATVFFVGGSMALVDGILGSWWWFILAIFLLREFWKIKKEIDGVEE